MDKIELKQWRLSDLEVIEAWAKEENWITSRLDLLAPFHVFPDDTFAAYVNQELVGKLIV